MNIGVVTTWFDRGAAYVSKAYRETLLSQHAVFVYARGGEKHGRSDSNWDFPYVTWAPRLPGTQIAAFHIIDWLQRNDIEAIIFNEQLDIDIVPKLRALGYLTGSYVDYYTKATIPTFTSYDFLLCNTRRHFSVFADHPRCLYIPWGTDTVVFAPSPPHPELVDPPHVTFFHSAGFGGTNLRKGTDFVVDAFQKVTAPARLLIHSQVPLSTFGRVAPSISSDRRISFVEATVPPPGLYHRGDVFVYPSRLEGIGLCVPEALACGLPVITTDVAPMNEFVHDGVNGLLVRVTETRPRADGYYWPESFVDVSVLAEKMQFLAETPTVLRTYKLNARRYSVEKLDWSSNSAGLGQFIETLKRRPRRSPSGLQRAQNLFFGERDIASYWLRRQARKLKRFAIRSMQTSSTVRH